MNKNIEIMAPAGSFESLQAAIKAGANSVYFGVEQLNMRARSASFTLPDLKKVVEICNKKNIKTYLTLNTIMYDHDLILMKKICDGAKKAGINAIIASDIAAMQYARSIDLEVHISTQANVSNIEAVKFYSQFADIIVLARELTLKQIKYICSMIQKENIIGPSGNHVGIEVFCHGALCVAISGKCYMSLATFNASANRGACLQNCRRAYRVVDEETGDELLIDNKYVMSPKDLCTISFLDQLLGTGLNVLKIEGRARSPEYVYTVTKSYREAVDSIIKGNYSQEKVEQWIKQLETVYNRGFWHGGYYLGKTLGEWSNSYGSKASKEKQFVGKVKNYFAKNNIAEIKIEAGFINQGSQLLVIGPTTGVVKSDAEKILRDDKKVDLAKKGDSITVKINEKVRKNDKVYIFSDRK